MMSQSGATVLPRDALARYWLDSEQGRRASGLDPVRGRVPPQEHGVVVRPAPARPSYGLYTQDCCSLLKETGRGARLIVTPNLDHLRMLDRSRAFRRAYASADVILNDSRFIDLLALRGAALCLPGSDLAPEMLDRLPAGERAFIVGGGRAVQDHFAATYPHLALSFLEPSMGYILRRGERKDILRQILVAEPDIVFICTGAPQSELFGAQLKRAGCAADILCCGGALQILARVKRRAPRLFRRLGAEWTWRFITEPHTRERYAADSLFLVRELKCFLELRRTGQARFKSFDLRARLHDGGLDGALRLGPDPEPKAQLADNRTGCMVQSRPDEQRNAE